MTTVQNPDPGRAGQFTQACPCCDGIMPAEAVRVGRWCVRQDGAVLVYERVVSMKCPHCEYKQARTEVVPESAFLHCADLPGGRTFMHCAYLREDRC